ncbi:MAG: hypothetical protein QOH65_2920 [Methylobacteriaceae bacterium]|jgi:hypothetical protein|nr:hypothetical protein [Methylobacteriaceae bacterium]
MSPLEAKRLNRSLDLLASSLNTLGLLGLVSGAIVPYITGAGSPAWGWLPAWAVLHISAHLLFNFIELEN